MTEEKWKNVIANIKDNFTVIDEGSEHLEEEGGVSIDFIVFEGPLGKIRLEFVAKPVVLDKKTIYSRRVGSETKVEYVYSDTEKTQKMIAYKWDEDQNDWLEIDESAFF